MTAFRATYADMRIVKGRKMAQFVFEVPLEQADAALEVLGGVPRPDVETWVGVARLDKQAIQEPPQKERRPFHELPLPQQAALICKDERFQEWMRRDYNWGPWHQQCDREDATAGMVRTLCGVGSRTQFARDNESGKRFLALVSRYRQETGLETWAP